MDGSRVYYAKLNKSIRERQIPYDFTYMWNLRNKQMSIEKRREKGKSRKTLNYREQTDSYQRGGG